MSRFDKICRQVISRSPEEKEKHIHICIDNIVNLCRKKEGIEYSDAMKIIVGVVCCAVAEDGRFAPNEYPYVKEVLSGLGYGNLTYDNCLTYINQLRKGIDLENETIKLAKELGKSDDNLQNNIALLCLNICAIDGYITEGEREFIYELFN